jgi:hypothetical protein
MGHHGRDLSAQMLFVETESLFAIAAIVQIGIQFHRFDFPFDLR